MKLLVKVICGIAFSLFFEGNSQCIKILSAYQTTQFGGREEAQQKIITVVIKNNKKLEPLYFLINGEKVDFRSQDLGKTTQLTGHINRGNDYFPQTDIPLPNRDSIELNKGILVFKSIKKKQLVERNFKIKPQPVSDSPLLKDELPQ